MDASPRQPDKSKKPTETEEGYQAAVERRRQHLLSMGTAELSATQSWGERVLPFLMAGMEACWVDAIFIGLAGIGFFQAHEPIMPLWAPFLLIAGPQWLARYLERRDVSSTKGTGTSSTTPGTSLVFVLAVVLMLFIIWSRVYAATAFVFDPRWLLSLLNDILLLDPNAYLVVGILAVSIYFCWRGVRLSRRQLEPAHVFGVLRLGLGILIAVIIVRAGQESAGITFSDGPTLFLLIPLFLALSLAAHALARATYIRRFHPVGLEGSVVAQERSIFLATGSLAVLILLISLWVAGLANPAFLKEVQGPLGTLYDWIVRGIAAVLVFLATPLFWLVSWLLGGVHPQLRPIQLPNLGKLSKVQPNKPTSSGDALLTLIPILKVVLPILFVLLVAVLVWWVLRRRRVRIAASSRAEEIHESVWSWELFLAQLKALFWALFGRFFARRALPKGDQSTQAVIEGGPSVRTIREIYRMLLKRTAKLGYPRHKSETPYEFRQRLDERTPLAEPRLGIITEAYAATRYGSFELDEAEVAQVQGAWAEVEQKWTSPR